MWQLSLRQAFLRSLDGLNSRRVGLIGVLSNSFLGHGNEKKRPSSRPSLYRPGAFGGAKIEDPWEVMASYKKKMEDGGCDVVVPLCHLYEPQERRLKESKEPLRTRGPVESSTSQWCSAVTTTTWWIAWSLAPGS